jgi:hypothetical protein
LRFISEIGIEIPAMGNFYLQDPSLDVYIVQQSSKVVAPVEQCYQGNIYDENLASVR